MRLQQKRLLYWCLSLSICVFVLRQTLFYRDAPDQKVKEFRWKVTPRCAAAFENELTRKKLNRALTLGNPDMFMSIITKYLPDCRPLLAKKTNGSPHGYGLVEPSLNNDSFVNLKNSSSNDTAVNATAIMKDYMLFTNLPRKPLCPFQSPLLRGPIPVDLPDEPTMRKNNGTYMNWPLTFEELAVQYQNLRLGGFYPGPSDCRCRGYNAIIVPYRDREEHLRYFLYYMHQLLQRQQLCYIVIVAEQDDNETFNKGQLMNTAFQYARELMQFDCYIFHDVDVIAEDDRLLYTCKDDVIMHYAPYIDKYNYTFAKGLTVGAAVGFTEESYVAVNGFSNEYAGWGGEDDDMSERITLKDIPVWRSEKAYSKFTMIKHGKDAGNTENKLRWQRLKEAKPRQWMEGLTSLETALVENIHYKTHTRLKIRTYKTGLQRDLVRRQPKKVKNAKSLAKNNIKQSAKRTVLNRPAKSSKVNKQ